MEDRGLKKQKRNDIVDHGILLKQRKNLILKKNRDRKMFEPYIKNIEVEGEIFDFYIGGEYAQKWYASRKSPEHFELAFVRDRIITEGDIVFDVGAQHGFHTIPYSNWVGKGGKVISFEAHPGNTKILKKI